MSSAILYVDGKPFSSIHDIEIQIVRSPVQSDAFDEGAYASRNEYSCSVETSVGDWWGLLRCLDELELEHQAFDDAAIDRWESEGGAP